jgi:hypothetical protein
MLGMPNISKVLARVFGSSPGTRDVAVFEYIESGEAG